MQEARRLPTVLALLIALSFAVSGAQALTLRDGFGSTEVEGLEMLRDPIGQLTIDNLLMPNSGVEAANAWQPAPPQPSLGFTNDTIWLRFTLRSEPGHGPSRALVEIGYPLLDEVDIYELTGETLLHTWNLGSNRPADSQPLLHRHPLVPIDFTPASPERTLLIRIRSDGATEIPLMIWDLPTLAQHEANFTGSRGAAIGLLLIVMLVFALAALITRARGFAWYLPHALALLVYQILLDGTAARFLGLDSDWWGEHGVIVAIWLIPLSGTMFLAAFLDTEHTMPRLHRTIDAAEISLLLALGASLLIPAQQAYPFLIPVIFAYGIAVCAIALYAIHIKVPLAWTFLLGTVLLFAGALASALNQFGLLNWHINVGDALLTGILLQAIALAWALSTHLKLTMDAQRAAQQKALAQQEDALARQHQLVAALEQRVNARSEELWQAMHDLDSTNRRLSDLSRRDGLTGVHNRRYFDERFPDMVRLASRRNSPLAVMMLDIDHFKQINDSRGHAIGDQCLKLAAGILSQVCSRSADLVARYGGEEFVIVLQDASGEAARAIAETVRSEISQLRTPCGKIDLQFTISIGLVMHVPQPNDDGRQLLAEADGALYRAKKNGRNCVEALL